MLTAGVKRASACACGEGCRRGDTYRGEGRENVSEGVHMRTLLVEMPIPEVVVQKRGLP